MFTVGDADDGRRTSRSNSSLRHHRWTARVLGLALLLVLLQLDSPVPFHTVAAEDRPSPGSSTSPTQSQSGSQSSGSLIDGIILDEDGMLLGTPPATAGHQQQQQPSDDEASIHLFFHPPHLSFAERSIGDPHNQPVVLVNRHKNRSVYLGSITGSTAEFSSSYFKDKMIPPGGNTTFSVVFLPRKLGPADGALLVHTSFGLLRYPVQGDGIECPYRLRPLVGLQAPLNATLSPEITLYNPHDAPLQIVEVYSSGGNFQLELPSGGQEGPQALWEIPPHSTRTVIRVRFHARTPGHHIAYVRIKISGGPANPSLVDKMLVVPIEVDIGKETGLYARIPFLELGVTSSPSDGAVATGSGGTAKPAAARRTTAATAAASAHATPVEDSEYGLSVRNGRNVTRLSLDLHNSGSQLVRVKSWGVQADDLESVLCMRVYVLDGPTLHVEFDWSKLTSERRHISGRILLNLERILSSSSSSPSEGMGDEEEAGEEDGEETPAGTDGRGGHEDDSIAVRATAYDAVAGGSAEEGTDAPSGRTAKVVSSIYAIPFAGEVLKGSIQYSEEVLRFLLPPAGNAASTAADTEEAQEEEEEEAATRGRPLVIRNHFNVPLSITNLSVPANCSRYFAIEGFRPPIVLQPNEERTLFRISRRQVDDAADPSPFTISTSIRLTTNISDYELPVLGYSGRLERLLSPTVRDASLLTPNGLVPRVTGTNSDNQQQQQHHQELDFGVLPIATIGEALVAFRNPNPVPIPIIHWKGAITSDGAVGAPTITVILRGCGPLRLDGLVFCHTVQPGEWIVYQISVQSGTIDSYQGRFTVKTDYEEIVTPLRFTTAVGELHLMRERLRFDDCFPGKLCQLSLLAASSFPTKIQIEGIRTDVPGLSYEFLSPDKQRPLAPHQPVALYPDTVTSIGRMTLDPKAHCAPLDSCYSSFDLLSKPFGVKWMATLDCYEQYRRLDSDKLLQQLQRYAEMRQRLTSVQFQVLAESSRRFDFNASVDLVWPKLLDENVFFPTLQVEQEAVRLITINNPSDQILFVHLVLHDVALHGRQPIVDGGGGGGGGAGGINLPPEVLTACDNCTLSEESVFSFFLFDSDDIYVNYVKPQSFLRIAVKFSATRPGTYSTVLYMRNNLTLIDAAWIQARAVVPQFKFGNRRPGSPTALQFEITEKHVRPCYEQFYRKQRSEGGPSYTGKQYKVDANGQRYEVKEEETLVPSVSSSSNAGGEVEAEEFVVETRRTFTARNYGEVPIIISGIRIEDAPCEGFGFKVLDCAPFDLAPNASRKIEIAFAPDFTLSRVTRVLHFDTNINHFPVNFTLLGTVPMQRLDVCSQSLPRPWFEYWLRTVLMVVLPTTLFGTLATAVLEANRRLRAHFLSHVRDRGPLQPPLDLRQIALQHTASSEGGTTSGREGRGNQNGSVPSSSSSTVTRRKADRKNGTQAKGGGLQNGGAGTSVADGSSSRFNRSWTDFTTKLGVTSTKLAAVASSPDASKPSQPSASKSQRRSVTPTKDQSDSPGSSSSSGSTGATKDRTKSPSATASETESNKTAKNGPLGAKAATAAAAPNSSTTSDLTGALESNSTANNSNNNNNSKQHHSSTSSSSSLSSASSSSSSYAAEEPDATEDRRHSSSISLSSSPSSSSSTTSSTSSSPSPTSKQQHTHHQSKQPPAATKTSVKKTKSLPVSYESVVVSLASVFAVTSTLSSASAATTTATTAAAAYTGQKATAAEVPCTSTATVVSSSIAASVPAVKETTKDIIPSKLRTVGPTSSSSTVGGKQLVISNGTGSLIKATITSNNHKQHEPTVKTGSEKSGNESSLGKENSSSGNIISHEKLSIGNGNAQQQQQVESSLNSHHHQPLQQSLSSSASSSSTSSSASKKFSKTPGRERKPNQGKKQQAGGTNGKGGTAGSQQQYKGTALQFNTPLQHKSTTLGTILQNASVPLPTPVSSNATIWGENGARFSDVVAQSGAATTAKPASGGMQSTIGSILPGMESFTMFGSSEKTPSNQQRSHGSSNTAYGISTLSSTGGGGTTSSQHYRKPLHTLQDLAAGGGSGNTKAPPSNRTVEQKAKDDSYLGGSLEKECSAPFVSTSGSPDLGPIGTSKKSPSGANSADGDADEADSIMAHMMMGGTGRMGGPGLAKCWEPFGGHVLHNPVQLGSGGSNMDPAAASTTIAKSMNGGQQSDSFFSQSFVSDMHHRQHNDPYRGSSMAGGSNGGIAPASLLSNAGHQPYTDPHTTSIGGLPNGTNNQPQQPENDFMEMHYRSRHQLQQQLSQQQQHDWNGTMQWSLASHKPITSQSGGMNHTGWSVSELWNDLNAHNQYQQQQHLQQQQQLAAAYEFQAQLAMAAAGGQRQLQQQTVPDALLGHRATSTLSDGWLGAQTTVAPPPGFSNHLPSVSLQPNRIVYEDDPQTLTLLLQQHRLQQQQQQQQMQQSQQQQLIRQLSSEESTSIKGGNEASSTSGSVASPPEQAAATAVTAVPTTSTPGTSSNGGGGSSFSSSSAYNPFQMPSIWTTASNNSDRWATTPSGPSAEET